MKKGDGELHYCELLIVHKGTGTCKLAYEKFQDCSSLKYIEVPELNTFQYPWFMVEALQAP